MLLKVTMKSHAVTSQASLNNHYIAPELQIRRGTEDNSKIIFLISLQKHMF